MTVVSGLPNLFSFGQSSRYTVSKCPEFIPFCLGYSFPKCMVVFTTILTSSFIQGNHVRGKYERRLDV
jgi:hypothetical protein